MVAGEKSDTKWAKVNGVLLLMGCIYISTTCISLARASGVLFFAMMEKFDVATATTGWVISIFAGLLLGAGAISGYLCAHLGAAVTAALGTFIMSTGMLLSAFVENIYLMYVTFGAVGGFGGSLTFVSVQVLCQQNFHKRRALAASLSSLGVGAGALIIPPLHTLVLVSHGFRQTFFLVSGLCFSASLVSVFLIRLTRKEKYTHREPAVSENAETPENDANKDEGDADSPRSCCSEYTFFSGAYISILISAILGAFAVFVPLNLLPAILALKGLTPDQTSTVLSCAGIGDIVGKIVISLVADSRRVDRSLYQVISLLVLSLMTLGAIFFNHMYQFMFYTAVFGMASGVWTCLQAVITMDTVGVTRLAQAFGLVCMVQGPAAAVGLPTAGWLVDVTSSFSASLITSGAVFFLAAVVSMHIPIYKATKRSRSETAEQTLEKNDNTKTDSNIVLVSHSSL